MSKQSVTWRGYFTVATILVSVNWMIAQPTGSQTIAPELEKKITISGFCLCKTTLDELKRLDSNTKEVPVVEMDLCADRFVQDSRFVNWQGYSLSRFPGIIFQKEQKSDLISKIRLTKDFKGALPDGTAIDASTLTAGEVLKLYPKLGTWKSRGCSDYWNLTNDTISFFVKVDKSKKPQYPVDQAYYLDKPIEGIDIVISCYSLSDSRPTISLSDPNDPLFFLDSIQVNRGVLQQYQPSEIAFVNVYKGENAIKVAGKDARMGAIFIITKDYARKTYWQFFKSRSPEYASVVMDLEKEREIQYVLNGKTLEKDFEKDLFTVNERNFGNLSVSGKKLKKDGRKMTVFITTKSD